MSFPRFRPLTSAVALTLSVSSVAHVNAQLFDPCNTCQMPVQQVAYNPCNVCEQPAQVVYRTVPVTEYQQVAQTVRKPIVDTVYEDRQYTEYRTVYEQRTAQVPTVSYQNVTECQPMSRDMGRWVTYRQPVQKYSPCAYDSSPGLLGIFNRAGYQVRSALTPNYTTHRQYVPNVVAYNVPVTRQVAVRGTQTVNYQVAKLEPHTTTRKVAVQRVRYEDEQVVAMRPVTSYRTVPIGTQTAYGFVPFQEGSGTVTAQAPTPDPISTRSAEAPTPVPKRTAGNESKFESKDSSKDSSKDTSKEKASGGFNPFGQGSNTQPQNKSRSEQDVQTADRNHSPASSAKPTAPSIVRVAGWRARATQPETSLPESGSEPSEPSFQVVKTTP